MLPGHVDDGGPALEASLTPEAVDAWTETVAPAAGVQVTLPRFEMRFEQSLVGVLSDLGMPSAFDGRQADFTGIADPPGGRLFIQDVIHDAFMLVDEEGTEAAAATGVAVGEYPVSESPVPSFVADHPFVFLIRDDLTGTILFMGRVADPS